MISLEKVQQVVVKADILEFRRGVWAGGVELNVFNILVAFKIMDDSVDGASFPGV